MMAFVNRAGETFVGDVTGTPPTEITPHWQCLMRVVPGGLTPEVRASFARLVRRHAKEHNWCIKKLQYTRSNVTFYVEPLSIESSASSNVSK